MSSSRSADAVLSIGNVAAEVGIDRSQAKRWAALFLDPDQPRGPQGERLYGQDDVDVLAGVRELIFGRRLLMREVRAIFVDKGVDHLREIGRAVWIPSRLT